MPAYPLKANLTKRCTVNGESRYCPVVMSANRRIKGHFVLVDGHEEEHREGSFYLEWRVGGKRVRLSVGNDPIEAIEARKKKESELAARANGVPVSTESGNGHRLLADAISAYLDEVQTLKKKKTWQAYNITLQYFQQSCSKNWLEQVDRADVISFIGYLRKEKELSDRSVANKTENLATFLKSVGRGGLLRKNDWPEYTETEPEVYSQDQLNEFFAACTEDEALPLRVLLHSGLREQELMHLYWRDCDFKMHTLRVSHKPDRNWKPKQYREREIPIPDALVEALKAHKAKSNGSCQLVFSTKNCRVVLDHLDHCKAIAERSRQNPDEFWLHKFRATWATSCLRAGVDLRTLMNWGGWSSLESVLRYLKPARSQEARAKVNAITWGD